MATKQRLIVCLDGTWNNRDNSTNVLHHFAIVREGDVLGANGNTLTQKKYYHEGVGTGMLDGISGGGFGFGLEDNVRDGYNWLVQHYRGASDIKEADEIYIFGFSRGAYTARSLVGLIARCGLLRRGAPITVSQLWENYCILGREHEERGSLNDSIFGKDPSKVRQITDLICDPWHIAKFENKRTAAKAANLERVQGQRLDDLNDTEQLLVRWSRRVRITYLGLYDTVGAVGFDALAIPGLKSKLALHHNIRPTTLIQSCRHALAMDEHRGNFNHTPFIAYMGHGDAEEEQKRDEGESQVDPQQRWRKSQTMWWRKIEQRWFVGAHSNIGGGYADNRLAQRPFAWLLEGAKKQGLECEIAGSVPVVNSPLPPVRDSFAEFAKPFWTMVIRGKRNYRLIDPEPESQASRKKSKDELPEGGFSLQSINEQIDPSVFDYWKSADPPANLVEYATRKLALNKDCENAEQLRALKTRKPRHPWLGEGMSGHVVLVLWAALAAVGLAAMHTVVFAQRDALPLWLLCSVAFGFVLVDWAESRANFSIAVGGSSARWRAFLDSIYWMRALGVTLFVLGVVASLTHLWMLGWRAAGTGDPWTKSLDIIMMWWLVPVSAGVGVVVANLLDSASPSRHKSGAAALAAGPLIAVAAVPVVTFLACLVAYVCAPVFGFAKAAGTPPPKHAYFAGLLLLLQIAVAYFVNAFKWVGQPMAKANLGKVTMLQRCSTPAGVRQCLERWRAMLACSWLNEDETKGPAARRMREILRESLWRDIIGFIPVYSVVLGFGLWFGAKELGWEQLTTEYLGVPLWLLLPLIAAVTDYIEDACHLRYLALHSAGRKPGFLFTMFSFAMTWIKNVAFLVAAALTLAAIIAGSWRITGLNEDTGWRGTLALLISVLTALFVIVFLASAVIFRLVTAQKHRAAGDRTVAPAQNPKSA